MNFPNIYKSLSNNDLCSNMHYAIIEDGKIIATNGHLIVCSDLGLFVSNPENAEGKVLDKAILKWLTNKNFKDIECTEKGFIATSKVSTENKEYSGYYLLEKGRELYINSQNENKPLGRFPNWKGCIPDDLEYESYIGTNKVDFQADMLNILLESFSIRKNVILRFDFCHYNRVVRVTLIHNYIGLMEKVFIMPCHIK